MTLQSFPPVQFIPEQMPVRLRIAATVMGGMCVNGTIRITEEPLGGNTARWALTFADALIAEHAKAVPESDQSEMAREITQLRERVKSLRQSMGNACNMIEAYGYQQALTDLNEAIDSDTEAEAAS